MKVNVFIPSLNAGPVWGEVLQALKQQTYPVNMFVLADSGSTDTTVFQALEAGFNIIPVAKKDFDHGGTRQKAISDYPDADIYVLLTQDAIPASKDTIAHIVQVFAERPEIGMAYGRQLPHRGATAPEAHARLFNYPAQTQIRGIEDASKYGIKTISCSNSFAAYRRTAFEEAGGFPSGTIMGEDVIVAGQMLLKGWKMAYVADACVYHSHDYTLRQEFERYFDIGVFHESNPWIFASFGTADREGFRYVKSELKYILKHQPLLLPKTFLSFFAKWLGYKLGLQHKKLSLKRKKQFSMFKGYWK
ncbi:rhamnosyltransferase [bacterium A37T11]|nr:rhamnosyltransferase [bacterium A37T11]